VVSAGWGRRRRGRGVGEGYGSTNAGVFGCRLVGDSFLSPSRAWLRQFVRSFARCPPASGGVVMATRETGASGRAGHAARGPGSWTARSSGLR